MAEEGGNGEGASAALSHLDREIKEAGDPRDGVDSISLLPDVILQTILSFLPTNIAIRTSILSKRWRHVWSDTPCLSFDCGMHGPKSDSVNKTLDHYTARKMMSFELRAGRRDDIPYIDRWIEFAMSRNVDNMSLTFFCRGDHRYHVPDFFYVNNSVKQLTVQLRFYELTIPSCSVSWTSLKMLSLCRCKLYDECMDKILSGCPILESLTLYFCDKLMVLDLSKSLRLRTLEIDCNICVRGPRQIVAPHLHCLTLINSRLPCTLVDVSSLKEARLDILLFTLETLQADRLQVMVLKMLEKLQNVDKLTFGENFLKILSLAELHSVPFPSLGVKDLTIKTMISNYVIPGIVRVLQSSPGLKKLTIILTMNYCTIPDEHIDEYLELQSLNPDQCWSLEARVFEDVRHWNIDSKHVASFMELMFKNTKTLEKMVVWLHLKGYLHGRNFEELPEMVPMLSVKNNVSIVLSSSKPNQMV